MYQNEFGEMVSFPICTACLKALSENSAVSPQCTHSKTTPEAALELISYSIIVVENFGPPLSEDGEAFPTQGNIILITNYLNIFLVLPHFLGL